MVSGPLIHPLIGITTDQPQLDAGRFFNLVNSLGTGVNLNHDKCAALVQETAALFQKLESMGLSVDLARDQLRQLYSSLWHADGASIIRRQSGRVAIAINSLLSNAGSIATMNALFHSATHFVGDSQPVLPTQFMEPPHLGYAPIPEKNLQKALFVTVAVLVHVFGPEDLNLKMSRVELARFCGDILWLDSTRKEVDMSPYQNKLPEFSKALYDFGLILGTDPVLLVLGLVDPTTLPNIIRSSDGRRYEREPRESSPTQKKPSSRARRRFCLTPSEIAQLIELRPWEQYWPGAASLESQRRTAGFLYGNDFPQDLIDPDLDRAKLLRGLEASDERAAMTLATQMLAGIATLGATGIVPLPDRISSTHNFLLARHLGYAHGLPVADYFGSTTPSQPSLSALTQIIYAVTSVQVSPRQSLSPVNKKTVLLVGRGDEPIGVQASTFLKLRRAGARVSLVTLATQAPKLGATLSPFRPRLIY